VFANANRTLLCHKGSVVTQEHSAKPYQQIGASLEARFCAPLIVNDVVVKSSARLWSPRAEERGDVDVERGGVDVERGDVDAERGDVDVERGDIAERVQTTKVSIDRTLDLSRRLDEVLSRPIRWFHPHRGGGENAVTVYSEKTENK
jgi:hypothetical protein